MHDLRRLYLPAGRPVVALSLILSVCLSGPYALGQKRTNRNVAEPKTDPATSTTSTGPKRTDRKTREADQVKVITKTEFVRVEVRANKGYLSVVAVPSAIVTLTPVNQKRGLTIKEAIKDPDGSLNLINLVPGSYKITITHDDYQPYTEAIEVEPARVETFVAFNKIVSKYGSIRIGGAPSGAKIFLDDKLINASGMTADSQGLLISRIPVGKHQLRVSKDRYVDFSTTADLTPGKQLFIAANLDLATVTLNLSSLPGARVYVGSEEKTIIPPDGKVAVPLVPGQHTIRVMKDGFQEWKRDLTLSLAANPVNETASLVPIPNSGEGDWQPVSGPRKWYPAASGWKFTNSGAAVSGDAVVLFDTEPNRDFNIYNDFKLEFDVVFTNGKGVAWVARAKDPQNYYLFEIGGPSGEASNTFNLYICRDGRLEWKDSRTLVERVDKKGDSFHVIFEARGNQFTTRMTIASAPSEQPYLIGIFQDETFSYGGVGFRGKSGSVALLQALFVIPK